METASTVEGDLCHKERNTSNHIMPVDKILQTQNIFTIRYSCMLNNMHECILVFYQSAFSLGLSNSVNGLFILMT